MLHDRVKAYADVRGQSFTAVAPEALLRGMMPVEAPSTTHVSEVTGLLVFNSGQPISAAAVAELIDEND